MPTPDPRDAEVSADAEVPGRGEHAELSRLVDAPLGAPVRVEAITLPRGTRRRLLELGVLPGAVVEVRRVAPLGDPLEIELGGLRLSLRRAEASGVHVRAVEEAAR